MTEPLPQFADEELPRDVSNTLDSNAQATFRPFHPNRLWRVYVRNLPHWRQPGATYFVTFRQDDSIPEKVLAEWLDIRERWYRAHSLNIDLKKTSPDQFDAAYLRIPIGVRRAFERKQARMLHEELDRSHGSCVLRSSTPRQIVLDSLSHFHGQRWWLGDTVLMPNHVHALVTPIGDDDLEEIVGSIKKWTSRMIGIWLAQQKPNIQPHGVDHQRSRFWQYESYDRIVRDVEELAIFRRYIANNPLAAKAHSGEYQYAVAPWLDAHAERPSVTYA